MMSPGPLAPITRPRRKTTARSYSLKTLRALIRKRITRITTGIKPIMPLSFDELLAAGAKAGVLAGRAQRPAR